MFRITYAVECQDMTIPSSTDELFEYKDKVRDCFEEFEIEFKSDSKRFYTGWLPNKYGISYENSIYIDEYGRHSSDIEQMSTHFRACVI